MDKNWQKAQNWEAKWWGDCLNTYGEEEKQIVYAQKMGLKWFHNTKSPYNIDLEGRSVLDIGGGVTSLLLKCVNRGECYVSDPILVYAPDWITLRYSSAKIEPLIVPGEELLIEAPDIQVDEVWIYNCLQHTSNPELICKNALKMGKIVRVFEWIDAHTNEGHPHMLTEENLNKWLGGEGRVEMLNHHTLRGKAYYGVFKGDNYV